jgi:hypothetical protein
MLDVAQQKNLRLLKLCIKHLRGNTPGNHQPMAVIQADKRQKAELIAALDDLVKQLEKGDAQEQTEQAQAHTH